MNRTKNSSFSALVFLSLILTIGLPFTAHTDRGSIYFSSENVKVSEEAQKAIILHNFEEEILILGTDLKAEKKIGIIQFIPFPSEPKVDLAPDSAFAKAAAMIKKYRLRYQVGSGRGRGGPETMAAAGIEIRSNKKLGSHDMTIIKVNDVSTFRTWVNDFFKSKGLPLKEIYPEEEAIVEDYVRRGIIYFVLDFVEVLAETRLIEPLMYKFKSRELYYPLKTSNTFGGSGLIELIIMAPTTLFIPGPYSGFEPSLGTPVRHVSLELNFPVQASTSALIANAGEDMAGICPEGKTFFKGREAFIQVIKYSGEYNFNKDIFIDPSKGLPSARGIDEGPVFAFPIDQFVSAEEELHPVSTEPESDGTPVLYEPFDREDPLVKLPGMVFSYVRGHDRGEAISFDGQTYLRESGLTFIPPGKGWVEGTVEFWLKPAMYPNAPQNVPIVLFNWFDWPKPESGYVGDISLTPEGKIAVNCGWEWGGGNPPVIASRSSLLPDTWTHVAVAWSKAGGYTRIYINNKPDAEMEMFCAPGSNGIIYPWLAGYGGFVGALDEVKIYKVPLLPPFYQ